VYQQGTIHHGSEYQDSITLPIHAYFLVIFNLFLVLRGSLHML
jgi:hypothetical protein